MKPTTETKKLLEKKTSLKPLYTRSVVNSLSVGMVNPFIADYAVRLGASYSEMGWFQSSANLSNNVMQVFWGRLSDRLKRRIPFIVFGGLIVALLWIPIMFVTQPAQLIVLLAFQALLGSMATPAWTALIGDLVSTAKLGRVNASINLWISIGSLIATLASGAIMFTIGGTVREMFLIPFIIATICGITASVVMMRIKEDKTKEKRKLKDYLTSGIRITLKQAKQSPDFIKYCYVVGIFEFFMSISWPLFAITRKDVLGASMLDIALLTVVQLVVTIVFQGWAGRLADSVGRRPLLIFFRFSLVTVPLAYAFAPNVSVLIAVSIFWGIAMAVGQASVTAYLLDVSPNEHRGSFAALLNLIIGVASFFGSLLGGYLSEYTKNMFGVVVGLQMVYAISIVGRGAGAVAHFALKETLKKS